MRYRRVHCNCRVGLYHWATPLVNGLILTLLAGTLVPFMVVDPKNHVLPPLERVVDGCDGNSADGV
jgi:succinate dehydrogenase hydrophobic anchor subunit